MRLPKTVTLYGNKHLIDWGEGDTYYMSCATGMVTGVVCGGDNATFFRLRVNYDKPYIRLDGERGWEAALAFQRENGQSFTNCHHSSKSMTEAVAGVVEKMKDRLNMLHEVYETLYENT